MSKILKAMVIAAMLFLLATLAVIVYLASRLNAAYKPVKEYKFNLTEKEFEQRLQRLKTSDAAFKFTVYHITNNGHSYYYNAIILFKSKSTLYGVNLNYNFNTSKPKLLYAQLVTIYGRISGEHDPGTEKNKEAIAKAFDETVIARISY